MQFVRFASVSAAVLALAGTALAGGTPSPSAPDQVVDANEPTSDEQTIIDQGHLDIGPRLIDGDWTIQIRDDTAAPPIWRSPEDVVVHLLASAEVPAPDDPQFDFIAADPSEPLWVVPQTQQTDIAWVGWNTQDPDVVDRLQGGMTMRFHGADGPGQFVLFLQNGNFAPAELLWSSSINEPQDVWALSNTHVHANWVFTEPGAYSIDIELLATFVDGTEVSDRRTLQFAVGEDVEPASLFGAASSIESATPSPNSSDSATAPPSAENSDGPAISVGIWVSAVAALLVIGGVVFVVARQRRLRREVELEARDSGTKHDTIEGHRS